MTSATSSITATPYESRELPKDTWSVIGDAAQGWNTDVPMTYDFDTQTFKLSTTLKADVFKFRANGKWDLNYGDTGADGALEADGTNIAAPGAGSYTITLNLNAKPKPTYTIKKN
jgi:hypothetical protein